MSAGCSNEDVNSIESSSDNNYELLEELERISTLNTRSSKSSTSKNSPAKEKPAQPPIWADCIEYSGIVVPATFKPSSGKFDELYVMPEAMFAGGLPLISDSKPGDQDYNGGRWHLNVLKAEVDPSIYSNACAEEDINPDHFISTDMYFECPMRPVR